MGKRPQVRVFLDPATEDFTFWKVSWYDRSSSITVNEQSFSQLASPASLL